AGSLHAGQIQAHEQGLALHVAHGDVDVAGQALRAVAVKAYVGDILQNAVDQPVAQGGEAAGIFGQLRNGQFDGGSQAHDAGQVFRARAQAALLRAAEDQVGDLHALADVERADALGRVELVAGKAEHVHVPVVHVDGHG